MSKIDGIMERAKVSEDETGARELLIDKDSFDELFAHARALEAMLNDLCLFRCPVCNGRIEHSPDCELARLLDE